MRRHNVKLIINPNADLGKAWRVGSDLRPIIDSYGGADWAGTVYPTHAIELARQAGEDGYELVIAAGGDGTVHEVVNGLMQVPAEKRPRLGIVPLGSGNDFAHALGVAKNPSEALRQLLNGKPKRSDVGLLEDNLGRREYWNNTLGIGFDATVTIRSHTLPVVRGFMMYLIAVLQTIVLNHEAIAMEVHTDQGDWQEETMMFVICNGAREGGGFMVAPQAVPDDGLFHYAAISKVSRAMMLRLVPEVMRGTHGRFKPVRMGHFTRLELKADRPVYIHIDGEVFADFGSRVQALKVEMFPDALEVLV
ncbi:MAG: diacylglycerol kinase family lipid kinase [Anaerolineales bacterium]|nr:diacylglycerol kinase family lipid kinase [Anaerolineales bacterium]